MEIAIAVFIGLWISLSAVIAYRHMKKEYENRFGQDAVMEDEDK